jgi:hypothetical protein
MPSVDIDLTRSGNGIAINLIRNGDTAASEAATLNGVTVSGTPEDGQVLTATSATAATWEDPTGGGGLTNGDAGDIFVASGGASLTVTSINGDAVSGASEGGVGAEDTGKALIFGNAGDIAAAELWLGGDGEEGKLYIQNTASSYSVLVMGQDDLDADVEVRFPALSGNIILDTSPSFSSHGNSITSISGDLSTHVANTSNPHSVTKTQVGLGSVENTALSTWAGSTAITTLGTITTGTVPVARVSGLGSLATQSGTFSGTSSGTNTGDQTAASLGLVIGTNVQAYDADLTTWANITPGSNVGTFLATPTLANLSAAVSDADIARTDAAQTFTGVQTFTGNIIAPITALALTSSIYS